MKKTLLLSVVCLCASMLFAQQAITLPYEFSFEDSEAAELANWVLNPGSDMTNTDLDHWCVGQALHSDGQKGLYISNDGGVSSNCGAPLNGTNEKIVQFAYRDFIFPDNGVYYVCFDYICPNMKLYAGYTQYTYAIGTTPTYSATSQPANVTEQLGTDALPNVGTPRISIIGNAPTWTADNFTLTANNPAGQTRVYRIYFAWCNSLKDSTQLGISAAIDNIQIMKAGCAAPTQFDGFVRDCDNVEFTWAGGASRYQFQYRKVGETNWRNRMVNNAQTSYTMNGMTEGDYDFRVRGICYNINDDGTTDTVYSPYVYLSNFNVFCPELHCINYINITDTNTAICTYGTSSSNGYHASINSPFQTRGVVDFGWESINSRHTVCWDTLATDPRTGDQLRMVPSGDVASVRLGNWNYSYGAEAITYNYTVDVDNSILLVRYALVLEDPSGHDDDAMPRFVIEIRDEFGHQIDSICGRVDLNPLNSEAGWTHVNPGSYEDVVFKDWTTLGLNLDNYVGQNLKISVATYDCFWGGHYGYAYFTMDCASARIKNTSCGVQQQMEVIAPEGFLYEWRAEGDPNVRSTEREVTILSSDPTSWICTLTSTENPDCQFDLTVNTTARYPQAEFSMEYKPENCENRYYVTNTSYIWTNEDGQVNEHRDEVCDEYLWDFGMGDEGITSETNPGYIVFPEEGGTYLVTLSAMIGPGEGSCRSDSTFTLVVPKIGDSNADTTVTICEGSFFEFHGERYSDAGDYVIQGKDKITGCSVNDRLHLSIVPNSYTHLPDTTVCYGESVTHGDYTRATTGDLAVKLPNQYGCDSMVVQHVTVLPEVEAEFQIQDIDEDHEYASISIILPGDTTCTSFVFDGKTYTDNLSLDSIDGGDFEVVLYNDFGCSVVKTISLKSSCIRRMIFQRWDDVLSIYGKDYRDARYKDAEFVGFQWYVNGELIPEATRSYLYQEGGLTAGAEYTCQLTYADGTVGMTCPFVPEVAKAAAAVSPTYITDGQMVNVEVSENCTVDCYSAMGVKMFSAPLTAGDNYLSMTLPRGVYVLYIKMADAERPFRVCVAD